MKYYLDVSIVDNEFGSQIEYKYRISNGVIYILNKKLSIKERDIARYYKTEIEFSLDNDSENNYFQRLIPSLKQKMFKILDCNSQLEGGIMIDGKFY